MKTTTKTEAKLERLVRAWTRYIAEMPGTEKGPAELAKVVAKLEAYRAGR